MTRHALLCLALLCPLAACGDDTCSTIEQELDRCGQSYYGDDNCELLLDDCSDDDRTAVEAMFQCLGDACEGAHSGAQCDVHFARLSAACQDSLLGG